MATSAFLRIIALVCFIVAAVICLIVDAPDVIDVLAAISVGLAFWVGSTLVP
jgi:hypothetical protein